MGLYEKALELSRIKEDREKEALCLDYLMETLMSIADQVFLINKAEVGGDFESCIPQYIKCMELIQKKDKYLVSSQACLILYRLGRAYHNTNSLDNAIKNLELFLENVKKNGERENEGKGQLLLASCYESAEKLNLAISYLEMFISQAQLDPSQKDAESKTCNQLGELYNKIGRYDLASQYFERHFMILCGQTGLVRKGSSVMLLKDVGSTSMKPRVVHETPELCTAKVQLGIAKANAQMSFFFETVADPNGVGALLNWKSKNSFGDYIPPTQRVMAE